MSIFSRFADWIASLFKHAEINFENLPADQQKAIIDGSIIPQVIKNNLDKGETAITGLIVQATNLPPELINDALQTVYKEANVATLAEYQSLLTKAKNSSLWNGILDTAARVAGIFLSKGSLTWESLGLGLLQMAYEKFVKGTNPGN